MNSTGAITSRQHRPIMRDAFGRLAALVWSLGRINGALKEKKNEHLSN
jgi:hypothetical protein